MSKLYVRYGTMGAGKTETLLNILYDYEIKNGLGTLVIKPDCDTKGEQSLISRTGRKRKVDKTFAPNESIEDWLRDDIIGAGGFGLIDSNIQVILVDEAQFMTANQINELLVIAHTYNLPVIAFCIRVDVHNKPFAGSAQLFAVADVIEEIGTRTLCKKCGKRATKHIRFIDGEPDKGTIQVVIDDPESNDGMITYASVCSKCWLKLMR